MKFEFPYPLSAPGGSYQFANGTAAAPSISFASDTDTGLYSNGANAIGVALGGQGAFSFSRSAGVSSSLQSVQDSSTLLRFLDTGSVLLQAGGTNQGITLAPSGTGSVAITGIGTLSSTRFLITGGRISSSGGGAPLIFEVNGSDVGRFSASSNLLVGTVTDSANGRIQLATHTTSAGGIGFGPDVSIFRAAANVLSLESGDALRLGNAYVAGAPGAATGTVTIQDSTGTTYRIPVLV